MKNYNCKDNTNQLRLLRVFRIFGLLTVIMLTTIGGRTMAAASEPAPVAEQKGISILSKCRTDLANRLKLQEKEIKLADAKTVIWPDAALGMPEIGKVYAQVETPGQQLILEARDRLYLYTTSDKVCRYGGPLPIWSYSMLYLQPVSNEANLNGDLYQCSLLGTNSIRLTLRSFRLLPSGQRERDCQAAHLSLLTRSSLCRSKPAGKRKDSLPCHGFRRSEHLTGIMMNGQALLDQGLEAAGLW